MCGSFWAKLDPSHSDRSVRWAAQETFSGGDTKDMTVLLPKDPARRMLVEWRDPSKQKGIKRISMMGRSCNFDGLAIGVTLVKAV